MHVASAPRTSTDALMFGGASTRYLPGGTSRKAFRTWRLRNSRRLLCAARGNCALSIRPILSSVAGLRRQEYSGTAMYRMPVRRSSALRGAAPPCDSDPPSAAMGRARWFGSDASQTQQTSPRGQFLPQAVLPSDHEPAIPANTRASAVPVSHIINHGWQTTSQLLPAAGEAGRRHLRNSQSLSLALIDSDEHPADVHSHDRFSRAGTAKRASSWRSKKSISTPKKELRRLRFVRSRL